MGHTDSYAEKFTKPKHMVIAEAYAKRKEDIISVSIDHSPTDPAGLNFDMNNLNSTKSSGMDASLTKYMAIILNRRNAVTSMDIRDPTMCAPCGSSCDSEISVSVRQFNVSVESRRSSVDSQVSVKMSETEIKAKVESRSQKHKSMNMKTKNRQRNCYASSRRTNRRTSSSSVESQMMMGAMRKFRYKYPNNNKIRLSSTAAGSNVVKNRQGQRRSACADFNISNINQFINPYNTHPTSLTTSEDENVSKASLEKRCDPLNMLVPINNNISNEDDDSLEHTKLSNEKYCGEQTRGIEENLYLIQRILQNNGSGLQFDNLLRANVDRGDVFNGTKNSRSSTKSSKSRQSRKQPIKSCGLDMITSSTSSSLELDFPVGATHSSYSGNSINGHKTHSRNSKASCDVGIQANAYDIASQTRSYDELDKDNTTEKNNANYHDEDAYTETHHLLPFKKRDATIISRRDTIGMSNSERVKNLLMPST